MATYEDPQTDALTYRPAVQETRTMMVGGGFMILDPDEPLITPYVRQFPADDSAWTEQVLADLNAAGPIDFGVNFWEDDGGAVPGRQGR